MKFLPTPVNGTIPIWVAGMWPNKKPFIRAAQYDGVCPISTQWPNQLTPADVKEIRDFVQRERANLEGFDFIITGDTTGEYSEDIGIVKPYEEVGVTWWCENINGYRFSGSTEKMIERIRKGPPKDT